jgi:hypothetical protein
MIRPGHNCRTFCSFEDRLRSHFVVHSHISLFVGYSTSSLRLGFDEGFFTSAAD